MTDNLPQKTIIVRYPTNRKGETWFHLGNMYWCSDYKDICMSVDFKKVRDVADFPHWYFMFLRPEWEQEFVEKWKDNIEDDDNDGEEFDWE